MKRCKKCKWFGEYKRALINCHLPPHLDARECASPQTKFKHYEHKPWMGWLWLIALIFIITLALMLGGCGVYAKYTDKDGRVFEYRRTGAQQIGEVLLEFPDGTMFLMDGQKSELPPVEITTTSIIIGRKEVKR